MYAPRLRLATLPTPLYRMEKLSEELGADLWVKRDDLTGFGCGGNKVRKAEFLLADAQRLGADAVITAGAAQSNHARVIAAAASRCGMDCHLVLSGIPPDKAAGNLLLGRLSGARFHFVPNGSDRARRMDELAGTLRLVDGRNPYLIPIGGSNVVGARGYVAGFQEMDLQLSALPEQETCLFFATSSGGTYAGLLAGRALCRSQVELAGVRVDDDLLPEDAALGVANGLAEELGLTVRFAERDLHFNTDFVGEGYGIPTPEGMEALRMVWRLEGILLDPVYTAKAMAGLIAAARGGDFRGKRAVFLHTGGEPSVFAAPQEWLLT